MIVAKVLLKNEMFDYIILKSHDEYHEFLEDLKEWYKDTNGEESPTSYLKAKYNMGDSPYITLTDFKDIEKYIENNTVFKILNVEEI